MRSSGGARHGGGVQQKVLNVRTSPRRPKSAPKSKAGCGTLATNATIHRRRWKLIGATYCSFLAFLAEHLGGAPSLKALAELTPADVRAFMAARRAADIGSRSLMRSLAGVRGFARYLERNGKGKIGALGAVRAPKIGKTLPRPLAATAATRLADPDLAAGDEREPWIHARDAAVLALLYGSGLRISEALGLKRGDFGVGAAMPSL